tara:strand:- start:667 stop:1182 length:516 start_codon:yes stop_codon:yes gene_type:complete
MEIKRILIIVSKYYKEISAGLLKGTIDTLNNYKEANNNIINEKKDITAGTKKPQDLIYPEHVLVTPGYDIEFYIEEAAGCFEIPYKINKNKNSYEAFIALGCVIRGETYHFQIISNEVARKIMDLTIDINKPISFGILTCENLEQAKKRSENNNLNKGKEAAKACLMSLNK